MCYTYDAMGNITSVLPAQIEGGDSTYNFLYSSVTDSASVNYVYDEVTKRLSSIITQSTTYVFTYDAFGNTQNISASGNTLASYTYNANNGKMNTLTYGNGLSVKYVYDVLDRIEEIQYNIGEGNAFETVYSYEYDVNSRLHSVTDHRSGEVTVYVYDGAGRLTDTVIYDTETYKNVYSKYVIYDTESKVTAMSDKFDVVISNESQSMGISYQYMYDESDRVDIVFMGSEALLDYSYDNFSRLSIKSTFFGAFTLDQFYSYTSSGRNQSSQVASVETELRRGSMNTLVSESTTSYVYDSNGNITQILVNGELKNRYTYDDLGQLIREDNKALNKTYTWTYDRAGNITSKTTYTYTTVDNSALATSGNLIDVIAYTYSGDRLISYDGNAITYDTIGNPTSIQDGSNTISLTWEGRELKSYSSGDTSITYSYNADGIRTQKVVGTKTYDYIVDGSRIVAEKCGNEYLYIYIYDESGSPIGIKVRDNSQTDGEYTYYYFEKNIQGDIVAIYNESGTKIGRYTYDAWGVPTTTISSPVVSERKVVANNPFRYRGYYYDIETGFYYLQSRYYDPEIGRFLNADGYVSTGTSMLGYNMFAYCYNNPVMFFDPNGEVGLLSVAVVLSFVVIPVVFAFDFVFGDTLSDIEPFSYSNELMNSDRIGGDDDDAFVEKALWYDIEGDGSESGTGGHVDAACGLDKGQYSWEYADVEFGTAKISASASGDAKKGIGASAMVEAVYASACVKIPIFGHQLKIGVEGNAGSVGFECKFGAKSEFGISSGVGGGIIIEWD